MKSLFKLSTLAVSVFAASQVAAIELYNNEGTTVNMSGAIAAQLSSYDYSKDTVIGTPEADGGYGYNSDQILFEDPGSYFGFDIAHDINGTKALAKLEWDVNFGAHLENDEALQIRQTYIGFANDTLGQVTIGRQESPYMKTDKGYYAYWVGGLNMMQSDELGSRRSPNTVVWQKDFDNLYIGLQYQAARNVDQISFGNGLNFGSFLIGGSVVGNDIVPNGIDIKNGFGGAITYTFDFGTYLAAAYNQANDINGNFIDGLGAGVSMFGSLVDAEVKQYAVAAEHHFMEGAFSLSARYERFDAKNGETGGFDSTTQNLGLGANMYLFDSIRVYAGYEMAEEEDNRTGNKASEVTMYNLGAGFAPVPWGEIYAELYNDDVDLKEAGTSKGTHFFLGAAVFF
ncbi:outer membrane porin putative [Vibrio maritimus]|uniref:Outer membrane porin putative n=1 Tax=Vibrio maritimus TaxID=990268 RepID=A0A090TLR5_9VIBR|nr:outer membrane porin putative [Vibrio maritimus]